MPTKHTCICQPIQKLHAGASSDSIIGYNNISYQLTTTQVEPHLHDSLAIKGCGNDIVGDKEHPEHNVGHDAGNDAIGNGVGEGNDGDGEEGGDSMLHGAPLNVEDVLHPVWQSTCMGQMRFADSDARGEL